MRCVSAVGAICVCGVLMVATPAAADGDKADALPSPDASGSAAGSTQAPPIAVARGAIVAASTEAAGPHARQLARLVYQDAKLRPTIDEKMAQALTGERSGKLSGQAAEIAAVVRTVAITPDEGVRRRLWASVGRDLGAQFVVIVDAGGAEGPTARVLRLPQERFLAVTLTPSKRPAGKASGPAWDWTEAVAILSQLASGKPPGPQRPSLEGKPAAATTDAGEDDDWGFLSSPWFWGGLGVVVTVGVTVLVLSQTALNDPEVVMLEGKVSP